MQPIAAWLVARPERAVIVLAASFVMAQFVIILWPFAQIVGGAVLVLLVLSRGLRTATLVAGFSLVAILAMALASNISVTQVFQIAVTIWVPGMILAILLQRMRSLTLVLQITVLTAMLVVISLYVFGEPAEYWRSLLEEFAAILREAGSEQQAELFLGLLPLAPHLPGVFVSIGWLTYVAALLMGYAAFRSLPGQTVAFGRFSDLNFGRVLAIVLALASIVAMVSAAVWLQNFSFVLFAIFWLQGMAMLHWLHKTGRLPAAMLAAIYALTFVLAAVVVPAVGVVGYTDAWFNYRPRIAQK